jgi:hypothetical protein
MVAIIQFRQPAPGYEHPGVQWPGLFGPRAFDSQIGCMMPFTWEGREVTTGTLTAAEVAADGSYALLTFDVPDDAMAGIVQPDRSPVSFGFETPAGG